MSTTDWYGELTTNPALGESYSDWYRELTKGEATPLEIQAETNRRRNITPELQESGILQDAKWQGKEDISNLQKAAIGYITAATLDPRELGQIITKNFPDIGMTETKDGRIFLVRPAGQLAGKEKPEGGYKQIVTEINKPGISKMDVLQGLGLLAMYTPAGAAATVPGRIGAAGATETALVQAPQAAMGGEFNSEDVATTMSAAAAGEAVVPLVKKGAQVLKERATAKELGTIRSELDENVLPEVTEALQAQRELEKQTGIEARLFPAQLSMTPSALAKQRLLPQLEASAPIATRQLRAQNQEMFDLTTAVIEQNFPPNTIINAQKRIRDAAKKYLVNLKKKRSDEFEKIYTPAVEAAQAAGTVVPTNNAQDILEYLKIGHRAGSPISKFLNSIEEGLTEASQHMENGSNIQALHNFKSDEIAQKVYEYERRHGPMNEDQAKMVAKIYSALAEDLRGSSSGYRNAMEKYIQLTPEIENYEASLLGSVSKLSDSQLTNLVPKFFNPNLTNEEILSAMKVINSADPEAAHGLVAKWLDIRIGGTTQKGFELGTEAIPNTPGKYYRELFQNDARRKLLYRLLNPEQKQNMHYLEVMLRRGGAGRAEGSSTVSFLQTLNNIKGRFQQFKDLIFRSTNQFQRTGDNTFLAIRLRAMAKAAYDPKYADRFNSIINAPKNSQEAPKLMTKLIQEVERDMEAAARSSMQTGRGLLSQPSEEEAQPILQ